MELIGPNLKKLSPKNRASRGLKSIVGTCRLQLLTCLEKVPDVHVVVPYTAHTIHTSDATDSDRLTSVAAPAHNSWFTWDPHVSALVKKCNGTLIGLSHVPHQIPRDLLPTVPTLVSAAVLSHVHYCLAVYGNGSDKNIRHTMPPKDPKFCAARCVCPQKIRPNIERAGGTGLAQGILMDPRAGYIDGPPGVTAKRLSEHVICYDSRYLL